jgi:hypothetical protein
MRLSYGEARRGEENNVKSKDDATCLFHIKVAYGVVSLFIDEAALCDHLSSFNPLLLAV